MDGQATEQTRWNLLLIDDDLELCRMMQAFFLERGDRLECACNGRDGLARAMEGKYDLIILDVMLPAIGGITLLRQLRRRSPVPVILLTARTTRQDRITGLDAGADDYLPKPFDPDELVARIRAVLRRSTEQQHIHEDAISVGDIRLDPRTRQAWRGSRFVDLTALEFDLLDLLLRSAGRIVSRDEITAALLERKSTPYDRALDVHISHLRKKLGAPGNHIRAIRGVGYVFGGSQ